MPEIRDLLRGAAPDARPYDEDGLRARVAGRRRRRRAVTGALLALVLIAGVGGAMALDGGDDAEPVVADQPTTSLPAKVAGVTAVAFVHDDVWTGDERGSIGRPDEHRVVLSGAVRRLEMGDVLWAAGDTWVAAIDIEHGGVIGIWDTGDAVADIQPLDDQSVAISLPDDDAIAIVRVAGSELEERPRIPVGADPTNLVLTTDGDLWVNDGDVICRIDLNARTAVDEQPWSGALLAPSMSGGIWAVDGDRVVDLAPHNLAQGVSVAEGTRYDVRATAVAETSFGLFVAGPAGLTRHEPGANVAEVVDPDAPSTMAGSGDRVAYVVGGQVRTAQGRSAANGGTETSRDDESASLSSLVQARELARQFVIDEMGWSDVVMGEGGATPDEPSILGFDATSPSLDRAVRVGLEIVDGNPTITGVSTFVGEPEHGAQIVLGQDGVQDHVEFDYAEAGLTPTLTVRYGEVETNRTSDTASFTGDLGFVPDTPGWVQIAWRNADGAALEVWANALPPGPFAAP